MICSLYPIAAFVERSIMLICVMAPLIGCIVFLSLSKASFSGRVKRLDKLVTKLSIDYNVSLEDPFSSTLIQSAMDEQDMLARIEQKVRMLEQVMNPASGAPEKQYRNKREHLAALEKRIESLTIHA